MPLGSRYPDIAIPDVSFSDFMLKSLYRHGDKTAIIEAQTERTFTFHDIATLSVKCASALYRRGLCKGKIIAICAPNCAEYVTVIIGAAACGAITTTCNPLYTAGEIKHQLQNSKPEIVFTVPYAYDKLRKVAEEVSSIKKIYTIGHLVGVESFDALVKKEDGSHFPRDVQIDPQEDGFLLPYSSGTTGLPKGVVLTHRNAVFCFTIKRQKYGVATDCRYCVLPLFHIFGYMITFSSLDQGVRLILDTRFKVERLLSSIEKYKVTKFTSVPAMLLAIVKSPFLGKYDLSSLVSIHCGGASLAGEIENFVRAKICKLSLGWGMTEAVPAMKYVDSTPPHSVGRICSNTKLKVIDVHTGKELGPNKRGEICIKGPQVMKGYLGNHTATADTIDVDGWLHCGDVGYYDENDMLFIVERIKEIIKYKGFQVAPTEVEAVLVSHPKIADAAVIGVADPAAGQVAKAFVVVKDSSITKEEINQHVAGRLSKFKHLHGGIEFCDHIPKTPTGKIMRRKLRTSTKRAKL